NSEILSLCWKTKDWCITGRRLEDLVSKPAHMWQLMVAKSVNKGRAPHVNELQTQGVSDPRVLRK
nr:hypothetical protein [Tanacetum cinerariifolium]